jgi:hypothetical protein
MKDFIANSVVQTVRVQNVLSLSRSTDAATLPSEPLACRKARREKKIKGKKYRHDRTRKRVIETTGIPGDYSLRKYSAPQPIGRMSSPQTAVNTEK